MKLFLLAAINFICLNKVSSQIIIDIEIGAHKTVAAEVKGAIADSDTAWKRSVTEYLNTAKFIKNGAKKGKYSFRIKYIISKEGVLSDIQCENDPGYGMCDAAVIAIKKSRRY